MIPNIELRNRLSVEFMKYYSDPIIQNSILSSHFHRETCLIAITKDKDYPYKKIRNLKLDNITSFSYVILNKFNYFKEPYNIYHSCATYKHGVPIFYHKGILKEELKDNQDQWLENCDKQIVKFDYFIDIDSPDLKNLKIASKDAQKIYKKLVKKHPETQIIFSGCGFHLTIPDYLKGEITKKDIEDMRKKAKQIYNKVSELIDYETIQTRRVKKTPETLVYREGDKYVMKCKKLEINKLENFQYEDYIYKKVSEI